MGEAEGKRPVAAPSPLPTRCPFCRSTREVEILSGSLAFAMLDGFPVSPGHVLVIPRRHVASWFDATREERDEIVALLDAARDLVNARHAPEAFNIGINDGPAAGQTVPHLHVHLIPRYAGDSRDPRGGVRWILPERADYWSGRDRSPERS